MREQILAVIREHGPIGVKAIAKILDVKFPAIQVEIYNNRLIEELDVQKGTSRFMIKGELKNE